MADLDAVIRAKLAAWGEDPCGYATCVVVGWAEMRAAIVAVVDLHSTDGDGDCLVCVDWDEDEDGDLMPYRQAGDACPTKRAIAKALGIGGGRG